VKIVSKAKEHKMNENLAPMPALPEGTIKIWHGPQHPGVTGNMSIELDLLGETIQRARTHVGYLHRGFEKLVERRTIMQAFTVVCRICVPEPDPNEENFARGIEELAGIEVPEKAQWIRTMVLEMARLASYCLWMGGQSGSLGLYVGPQWAVADRDLLLDLFEELTGARVYHMYIIPGGVRNDLPQGFLERLEDFLDYFEKRLSEYDKIIFNNAVFKHRTIGIGIVNRDTALQNGVVGPVLRACGIAHDVRKEQPYLKYDQLQFEVPVQTQGDVYARAMVRRAEMQQTINILRQIIAKMPQQGDVNVKLKKHRVFKIPKGETFVRTESVRGEFAYYMASDGSEKLRRMQVKGPSIVHAVTLLEQVLQGAQLADVAMIMNSLGTCPPEIER
jgi:NADH-quinone oxidoreductase subunit D